MSATSVDEIAASLVREYLSRKGLKSTLAVMDEERPRTHESISNRAVLAQTLHMEKLMRKNKEKNSLPTMIEVMASYFIDKSSSTTTTTSSTSSTSTSLSSSTSLAASSRHSTRPSDVISGGNVLMKDRMSVTGAAVHPPLASHQALTTGVSQRGERRGFKPRSMRELESDHQKSETNRLSTPSSSSEVVPVTPLVEIEKKKKKQLKTSTLGDLVCEDLEEEEEEEDKDGDMALSQRFGPSTTASPHRKITGSPISLDTAKKLRELIFGSATSTSFNMEWRQQGFTFCELHGLEYGLVQHKGGPCGVLACLQAFILKHHLFPKPGDEEEEEERSPGRSLILSMTEILWRLGRERNRAVVALPPSSLSSLHHLHQQGRRSLQYKPDQLTEMAVLYTLPDKTQLEEFLTEHIHLFQEERGSGCIHFLFSLLLSKGIQSIRDDMDDSGGGPGGPLIAVHNYCSQELVNLILSGHAVSNVFDDDIILDAGTPHKSVLRGIKDQSQIGFLSLFEHYGNCIVGSNYKEPVYPIWLVCSESHFTVLFSQQRHLLTNWELEKKFDLFYYDGLACQTEEIRLTIDTTMTGDGMYSHKDDLVPPLEQCIRTKWRNATIDWNNTEPLL